MPAPSFTDRRRIHLGLAVSDLGRAEAFYRTLLGAPPVKQKPGYVKFTPEEPSLNLSLNLVPGGRAAALALGPGSEGHRFSITLG